MTVIPIIRCPDVKRVPCIWGPSILIGNDPTPHMYWLVYLETGVVSETCFFAFLMACALQDMDEISSGKDSLSLPDGR